MQENQMVSKNEQSNSIAAQALRSLYSTIAKAAAQPQNQSLLFTRKNPPPLTWGRAKAMLLTPSQADALSEMQDLLTQIAQLVNRVNVIAVAHELDMPRIYAPEITERLMAIDERAMISARVASRLGVAAVMPKHKHAKALNVIPRTGTENTRKSSARKAA
jgi:hypothetical protein